MSSDTAIQGDASLLSYRELAMIAGVVRLDGLGELRTSDNIVRIAAEMGEEFKRSTARLTCKSLDDQGWLIANETEGGEIDYEAPPGTLRSVSVYIRNVCQEIGGERDPVSGIWAFPEINRELAEEQYNGDGELTFYAFVDALSKNQRKVLHAVRAREWVTGKRRILGSELRDELRSRQDELSDSSLSDAVSALEEGGMVGVERIQKDNENGACYIQTTEAGIYAITAAHQCLIGAFGDQMEVTVDEELPESERAPQRKITTDVGMTSGGEQNNTDVELDDEPGSVVADD